MFRKYDREENGAMNAKKFGEKVAALRKQKGFTQTKLAELLNVSNKTISRWETGEGFPEISLLKPLAAALETTVDELLSDEKMQAEGNDDNTKKTFPINTGNESRYEQVLISRKSLKEFWKSLLVFNKIAVGCLVACVLILIGRILVDLTGMYESTMVASCAIYMIFISNIGLCSCVLGLILDLLGCYKKQTRGYVIMAAVCFVGRYVFPWLTMWAIYFIR